jgi:hypothetical protein
MGVWAHRRREKSELIMSRAGGDEGPAGPTAPAGRAGAYLIYAPAAVSRRNTAAGGHCPRGQASHRGLTLPAENGLVLDQQIVEFASLHALDQSGDLSMGVDEGGAFGVA